MNQARSFAGRCARSRRLCPALALAAPLALSIPSVAQADQVVVVQGGPPASERYVGPNWYAFSSGLVLFGTSYVASAVVAGTSSHPGDQYLYIPIAGPWVDMANRCSGTNPCNGDVGNKILLGFDGVFQAVGTLSVVSSFFIPHRRAVRTASPLKIQVSPASYGRGAPGLSLTGTF